MNVSGSKATTHLRDALSSISTFSRDPYAMSSPIASRERLHLPSLHLRPPSSEEHDMACLS